MGKEGVKLILVLSVVLIISLGLVSAGIEMGPPSNQKKVNQDLISVLDSPPESYGYIIQFKDKPIVKRKFELEKEAKENKEYVEGAAFYNPVKIFKQVFSIMPEDVDKKIKDYSRDLERKNSETINKIKSKMGAISNVELEISNEFTKVFNGISLDISEDKVEEIKKVLEVKAVYSNLMINISLMDSVPLINADDVWLLDEDSNDCSVSGKQCLTGEGVTIAILDSGIDYMHPDLGGCFGTGCKVIGGWDFVTCDEFAWFTEECLEIKPEDGDPMDDAGHGAHVAAIAAGNGVLKGVAPDASLYAYKVLNKKGQGLESWIISGIERAVDPNNDGDFSDHVDVISMSLGSRCGVQYNEDCGPNDPMSQAVDNVFSSGVVVVTSAGNSGPAEKTILSPATARNSISVGIVDKTKNLVQYSSRGPVPWSITEDTTLFMVKPDVLAPGLSICSAKSSIYTMGGSDCLDNNHVYLSGTSMATPHVAGIAALLKQKNESYSPKEIKFLIKQTSILLNDEQINSQGSGFVDALESILFSDFLEISLDPIEITSNYLGNPDNFLMIIKGRIYGNDFNYYILSYAEDQPLNTINPGDWNELINSNINPEDGIFYQNIISFQQGEYIIKFQVFDQSGKEFVDYSYFEIKQPECNDKIDNDNDGLVDLNDMGCQDWRDLDESNCGDNVCEPFETKASCPDDCGDGGFLPQLPGWPIHTEFEEDGEILPAKIKQLDIGDLNNDGYSEIAALLFMKATTGNYYYGRIIKIFNYTGGIYHENWEKTFYDADLTISGIKDLNNNGDLEFITFLEHQNLGLVVFDKEGNILPNWPKIFPSDDLLLQNTIKFSDLNNNGNVEIIISTKSGFWPSNQRKIDVVDINGVNLLGWPYYYDFDNEGAKIGVGDINGDGNDEVVIITVDKDDGGNFNKIIALDSTSNEILNTIFTNERNAWISGVYLEDIDNDGDDEIITDVVIMVQTSPTSWASDGTRIFIFNGDGSLMDGWPKLFEEAGTTIKSIKDINNDGYKEILINSPTKLTIYDYLGNEKSGWPFNFANSGGIFSLIVKDIDGDNIAEIFAIQEYIVSQSEAWDEEEGKLYGWDINGNLLGGYPKTLEGRGFILSIIDLNKDGMLDMIISEDVDIEEYKVLGEEYIHSYIHAFSGIGSEIVGCIDNDNDGWNSTADCNYNFIVDCNDNDFNINPGATERCNSIDDNCVDGIDENNGDCSGATPFCASGVCVASLSFDVNNDGSINVIDLALVIYWQGKSITNEPNWDDYNHLDVNGDNIINFDDVIDVMNNIG